MKIQTYYVLLAFITVLTLFAGSQDHAVHNPHATAVTPSDPTAIPDWFMKSMEETMQDGGRWIADNADYKNDTEPYDAYAMVWTWGIGKKSLVGRLSGIQDGEETGTFWEFRQVWHPGEQKAYVYQLGGDGTFGVGPLQPLSENMWELDQTFFTPDGTTFRSGHRNERIDGEDHTRSYNILEDGTWEERRFYLWKTKR